MGVFPDVASPSPSFLLVDTIATLRELHDDMYPKGFSGGPAHPTVAFDLECYCGRLSSQAGKTCLIQLSFGSRDYVIDVLSRKGDVWSGVTTYLLPLFADSRVVKVGQSIRSLDVGSLYRDFGIIVVNAFDLYEASKELNINQRGLAHLHEQYGLVGAEEYFALKKKYQACDWAVRPLSEGMIRYSRYDVHYCGLLRNLMIRDLIKKTQAGKDDGSVVSVAELRRDSNLIAALRESQKGCLWVGGSAKASSAAAGGTTAHASLRSPSQDRATRYGESSDSRWLRSKQERTQSEEWEAEEARNRWRKENGKKGGEHGYGNRIVYAVSGTFLLAAAIAAVEFVRRSKMKSS